MLFVIINQEETKRVNPATGPLFKKNVFEGYLPHRDL